MQKGTVSGEIVPDTQYRSFQLAQRDQILTQQTLVRLKKSRPFFFDTVVFLYDLTQNRWQNT